MSNFLFEGHKIPVIIDNENENIILYSFHYTNGRISIYGVKESDPTNRFMALTINIPEIQLNFNEIIIKINNNLPLLYAIYASGFFEDTHRRIKTGVAEVMIWKIKEVLPETNHAFS